MFGLKMKTILTADLKNGDSVTPVKEPTFTFPCQNIFPLPFLSEQERETRQLLIMKFLEAVYLIDKQKSSVIDY